MSEEQKASEPVTMPAYETVPEDEGPRTYEVVGPRPVHGHKRGERFTADLPQAQEDALVFGGHIKRVEEEAEADGSEEGSEPEEGSGEGQEEAASGVGEEVQAGGSRGEEERRQGSRSGRGGGR